MTRIQALGIQRKRVEDRVGVLAFLGDETAGDPGSGPGMRRMTGPRHRAQGHFTSLLGGEVVVGVVEEVQFSAGGGVLDQAFGGGEGAVGIGLQHAYGADSVADEFFQALLLQAIAGEGAEPPVYEQLDLQAAVQGVRGLVHLAVQQSYQVHQRLGQRDTHPLSALLLRIRQAVLRQCDFFVCQ